MSPGAIETDAVDVRGDGIPFGRREVGELCAWSTPKKLRTSQRPFVICLHHLARSAVAIQVLEAAALAEPEE